MGKEPILAQCYLMTQLVKTIQELNPTPLRNEPEKKIRQACVGVIFRVSPKFLKYFTIKFSSTKLFLGYTEFKQIIDNFLMNESIFPQAKEDTSLFEILFIQRSINKKDRNSGQIAFPGGKCDNNETDIEAVQREIKEEIGIDLNDEKNLIKYMGKLKNNFYYSKFPNEILTSSMAIFFEFGNSEIILNPQEIRDYKWVPALLFMNPPKKSISRKEFYTPNMISNFSFLPKIFQKLIFDNYLRSSFAVMDIGMDEILWGFTFEMLMHVIQIFENSVINCKENEISQIFTRNNFLKNLNFANHAIKNIKTIYKRKDVSTFINFIKELFDLEIYYQTEEIFGFYLAKDQGKAQKNLDKLLTFSLYSLLFINIMPKI